MKKSKLLIGAAAGLLLGSGAVIPEHKSVEQIAAQVVEGTAMSIGDVAHLIEVEGLANDAEHITAVCQQYHIKRRDLVTVLESRKQAVTAEPIEHHGVTIDDLVYAVEKYHLDEPAKQALCRQYGHDLTVLNAALDAKLQAKFADLQRQQ